MNVMTIVKKLSSLNMLSTSEDSMALFSDCFNKFGISLLLLNDEDKFNHIVDLLKENSIPLQKANGIYALRIFAVEGSELENIISMYKEINELNFLRMHPEMMAEAKNIYFVAEKMKKLQSAGTSYKNENDYDMALLLSNEESSQVVQEIEPMEDSVNDYLKKYLEDPTLIDKLENMEGNDGEEDVNIALELQKVENRICEEYLLPVDDGWKIVINKKEVNSFQTIKNTINTITKLNLPITPNDALLLVVFYKTNLEVADINDVIHNELFKEGM